MARSTRPPANWCSWCVRVAARTTVGTWSRRWGRLRPEVPKLLIWDNAPSHHPKRVREAAERAHITIAWLPFRSPELNPCEDLGRLMKAGVAANRPPSCIDEVAQQAVTSLDALAPDEHLRRSGLFGAKFHWLAT
jgi:transposase